MEIKDAESRSAWLDDALDTLSDREQHIIRERHLTYETVTLEVLGKELGISKERVRQLEQRAMEKLKGSITDVIADPTELFIAQ
jgi:RNA polymerase sigma-32 factor